MQYLKYKYTRKSINDKAKYGNYRKKSAGIGYICAPGTPRMTPQPSYYEKLHLSHSTVLPPGCRPVRRQPFRTRTIRDRHGHQPHRQSHQPLRQRYQPHRQRHLPQVRKHEIQGIHRRDDVPYRLCVQPGSIDSRTCRRHP